jgi:glycosylphosphatidylinositol transamidase (GPIT) subunit GPI8
VRLNRASDPKTITSFYKPKERIEARKRSDVTIIVCIVVIIVVALVRGL